MANIIIKEEEGIKKFDNCVLLEKDKWKAINGKIKLRILELLSQKALYIKDIALSLGINEQNIYYHLKDMTPLLEIVEEKKIRGTIARKYKAKSSNICLTLKPNFKEYVNSGSEVVNSISKFFYPFISDGKLTSKIVIGSPDPHGQYKARARDGHYAIDLALFLGQYSKLQDKFSTLLDVDVKLKSIQDDLIIVGGPVTNLIMGEINKNMLVNFIEDKHWAIRGKKGIYNDDNIGIIARLPNPYQSNRMIMVIAGVRYSGTKAAVIALTRMTQLILSRYTGQKEFYAIIEGYDLDGDGKLDSIELIE